MKRLLAAVFTVALIFPVGCAPKNQPTRPATLAPGYMSAADQQMGQILAGARQFYLSIQSQSQSGTLTLTPTVKVAFNDFGAALNTADSVYLAYHQGNATQAQAQAAINLVQQKQAALPLPGSHQ